MFASRWGEGGSLSFPLTLSPAARTPAPVYPGGKLPMALAHLSQGQNRGRCQSRIGRDGEESPAVPRDGAAGAEAASQTSQPPRLERAGGGWCGGRGGGGGEVEAFDADAGKGERHRLAVPGKAPARVPGRSMRTWARTFLCCCQH